MSNHGLENLETSWGTLGILSQGERKSWRLKLMAHNFFYDLISCFSLQSYKLAQIVPRSGAKIVDDMSKEIKYMMDAKISAVRVSIFASNFN